LSVDTIGPRRIAVGKESSYEVIVRNTGQVGADEVVVTLELPAWAEVLATAASAGSAGAVAAEPGKQETASKMLRWRVGRLEAKGQEKLTFRIVPRQSKPFDLTARCDFKPVSSSGLIEVQEPKLEAHLHGPRQVLYGKAETYRLELSNPGTGDAENVTISVVAEGSGDNSPAAHRLGTLAAGEKKVIEVELTARQAGTLTIKVDARADGGLSARLAETIVVQRAALAVSIDAPSVQFVGTEANYRIVVKNSGNAPAAKVEVVAAMPPALKFVSCTHNGQAEPHQGKVTWSLESLAPGSETVLGITGVLSSPGSARLQVTCSAESDLMTQAVADTQVEAMADLVLSVKDPTGPIAVGAEAVYEVRVHNRGSKAAEAVEVITYFSHGLEPVAAEGGPHRLAQGQVAFESIPSLNAGESVILKVKARADVPGNHVVRTEVHCRPLGVRLISEETNYFYQAGRPSAAGRSDRSSSPVPASSDTRSANRPEADTPSVLRAEPSKTAPQAAAGATSGGPAGNH